MPARGSRPNELTLTRIYDAPVEAVWHAWTDPQQVAKWWGPRGFTITTHSKDLRPGGRWDYTMHGPDGTDYPNLTTYLEVEPFRKLVYDHGATADRPPLFRVTVRFSEIGGRTKMEMTMTLPTAEAAQQTREFVRKANGNTTWDRLAEHLASQISGSDEFVINRTFDAPLATTFRMWTDPNHLTRWLPPAGFEMRLLQGNIRAGSSIFFVMTGPNDARLYARFEYLELCEPDRIVYTQRFCDENGVAARHPMVPKLPETLRTTVRLAAEGSDRTRVTVTMEPVGAVTSDELETFIEGRTGMTQGWTGSFDKLETLLAAAIA